MYGASKIIGEQLCRLAHQQSGLDYVVLRYSTVYGERQHYRAANSLYIMETYDRVRRGERPLLPGDGSETKHFVYVGDVARANVAALRSPATNVAVNVSGVDAITTRALVGLVLEHCKSALAPETRPDPPGTVRLTSGGAFPHSARPRREGHRLATEGADARRRSTPPRMARERGREAGHNGDGHSIMSEKMQEAEVLARCAKIAVSTWSDALDEMQISGLVEGIAQRSGTGRMLGFAVTARQVSGDLGEYDKSEFAVGRLVAATGPGKTLMIDVGGAPGIDARRARGIRGQAAQRHRRSHRRRLPRRRRDSCDRALACESVGHPAYGQAPLEPAAARSSGDHRRNRRRARRPRGRRRLRYRRGAAAHLTEVLERATRILAVDEEVERRLHRGESFADAAAAAGYIPKQ